MADFAQDILKLRKPRLAFQAAQVPARKCDATSIQQNEADIAALAAAEVSPTKE
jgi:hypothetical protein